MEEPLQRSLERYDVLDRIAVGGMAEVFLAKAYGAHGFEKTLAIKRILPELARDPEFEARFIAEAKVAVRLSHANVVQVFDFGRIGESLFIAMEFVDGLDLAAMLRKFKDEKRQVPLPAAFHIAIEIVRALDFAHGHNVVHRDVSPSNILISRAGEVKIADFGIAVAASPHRISEGGPKRVMGKWRYMSPEQTRGDTLDTRSDMFSAAAVIYELFTNEKLFPGEEAPEIIKNIADMPIPRMTALRPNLPSRLDEVLGGPLSRKPIDRPNRPASVLRSLIELSYESSIMATALDVAEALATVIPAARMEGRGALDDVIRKQMQEGSIARRTAVTDGKPPSTQSVVRTDIEGGGDVSTGLFRKVDLDGLARLEIDDTHAPTHRASDSDLHNLLGVRDKDRHTEVGEPPPPTGKVPKDLVIDSVAETKAWQADRVGKAPATTAAPVTARRRGPLLVVLVLLVGGGAGAGIWAATRGETARPAPVVTPVPADAGAPVEAMGTILVDSIPSGATVTIGTAVLGPGPKMAQVQAGAAVHVKLERKGYVTFEQDYTVEANTRLAIQPNLVAAPATLAVESTPAGATVTVAGQLVGVTPLVKPVAVGEQEVKLAKPGFDPIALKASFLAGETTTIKRDLKEAQRFGFVTIKVTGSALWADVYLGNKLLGRNVLATGPSRLQVPTGRHTLRLVNPHAKKEQRLVVDVPERATKAYTVAFN